MGKAEDTPEELDSPGKRAIYNVLTGASGNSELTSEQQIEQTVRIDLTIKEVRPDGWRGVQAKEQVIKAALYEILQDTKAVDEVFNIVSAQKEY